MPLHQTPLRAHGSEKFSVTFSFSDLRKRKEPVKKSSRRARWLWKKCQARIVPYWKMPPRNPVGNC
jgi:hypothetical protein